MLKLYALAAICTSYVLGQSIVAGQVRGGIEAVRLMNGSLEFEGRLEVMSRGVWGSVCDDNFDINAAMVACRSLGYPLGIIRVEVPRAYPAAAHNLPILLDEVRCAGNESSLNECLHNPIGINDCSHGEDVGISCGVEFPLELAQGTCRVYTGYWFLTHFANKNSMSCWKQYSLLENITGIRLVGGPSPRVGRLEILFRNVWGSVCNDGFHLTEAGVACRMLGFGNTTAMILDILHFGIGRGQIWMDDVDCERDVDSLAECRHSGWGTHNCAHPEDVAIACSNAAIPN